MKKSKTIILGDCHCNQTAIPDVSGMIHEKTPFIVIKGDMNNNNSDDPSILNKMPILEFNFSLLKPNYDLGKKKVN